MSQQIPEPELIVDLENLSNVGIDLGEVEEDISHSTFETSSDDQTKRTDADSVRREDDEKPDPTLKTGPPDVKEWQDFFSRIVLRTLTNYYVTFAFRGIDEDIVSDRDIDRMKLTKEERQKIAAPLATFSTKSKLLRKHGRLIVSSGDSIDALISLGTWASRVNRLAHKYRRQMKKMQNPMNTPAQNIETPVHIQQETRSAGWTAPIPEPANRQDERTANVTLGQTESGIVSGGPNGKGRIAAQQWLNPGTG
jgi:hypothetical protein